MDRSEEQSLEGDSRSGSKPRTKNSLRTTRRALQREGATEVTRYIKPNVERELWGRAAGRCQFSGCNKPLYKHEVTQEKVNLAEKAHIYSFSIDGPRGRGPYEVDTDGLNELPNLLLVCGGCHELIDVDEKGEKYSADLLKQWKEEHETRVRIATGISPTKQSHVVLYGARIGEEHSPLSMIAASQAMFPDWYPADERPINLWMQSGLDDRTAEFWIAEQANLRKKFDQQVRPRMEEAGSNHFSIFAMAPQPLLIQLGTLLTDKANARVYQPIREPKTWRWQPAPDGPCFIVNRPNDVSGPPAVLFSISDKVSHDRVHLAVGATASVWEVTAADCHNDCLRSEAQLSEFRQVVRKLFVDLRAAHPTATEILIFPVMPVACAIELGRVRMPKADLPWLVYDHHNKENAFVNRLTIGGAQ